jgi:AcrR family transcriptional regulator
VKSANAARRPAAGRPTREQARQRHDELLDRALDVFLNQGFEQATIEAIAAAVGMTKRTVYARYENKAALFLATVQRAIERMIVPEAVLRSLESVDLETMLAQVARLRIAQVTTPAGLKLQRIINTESYRFPEIFMMSYQQGARPVIQVLARRLQLETEAGRLNVSNPEMAANVFMSMVVGGPVRLIVAGQRLTQMQIDERQQFAIQLFLDGIRPRGAPSETATGLLPAANPFRPGFR